MIFYPPTITVALTILALSLLMDFIYPYHSGILLRIHPVHTCFVMAKKLIKPYANKLYGVFLGSTCILIHIAPLILVLYLINLTNYPWSSILWIIAGTWTLKTSYSIRLLMEIGLKIYNHSKRNEWSSTRYWVQQIVRRNVYELDEEHVLSAAIESLAESLVDGIVSPLFYYPFLGILGPFLQRIVNTLDGAVGFKTPELLEQGWFSAKLDTILNYIPARLSALYIILSSMILGYNWKDAWRIYLRDHGKTASLNAGHPMSAMAGALGVILEKIGCYKLGDKTKTIEPNDVLRAVRIVITSATLHIALVTLLTSIIWYILT